MQDVLTWTQSMVTKYGAENVLIAFDMDNTLLTMNQELGSDQWFSWQESLLFAKKGSDKSQLVASNFGDLLKAQGLLFSLSKMTPPEKGTPRIVKKIQALGVHTFILTSRGFEFFYPSVRELYRGGYNFAKKAVPFKKDYKENSFFLPFNPDTVGKDLGLTKEQVKSYKLNRTPRPVLYNEGVFLTAGQHKGAMLKIWLKRTGMNPKAIIFVDDHQKHVKRVKAAFDQSPIDLYSVHYINLQDKVNAFKASDKKQVSQQWSKIKSAMDTAEGDKLDKIIHSIFL